MHSSPSVDYFEYKGVRDDGSIVHSTATQTALPPLVDSYKDISVCVYYTDGSCNIYDIKKDHKMIGEIK